ncbi:MAG TPA: hypothetical protein VEA69_11825 [Tepidisphaeraceae bacterium]|nr:hypothetical protein [Tepidisphaeraceae bacterium]
MTALSRIVLRLAFAGVCVGGCVANNQDRAIRPGTPITHVQFDFGVPDVISDESGSEGRFYSPYDRPPFEWPADAPRTFFYFDRNVQVVFVNGKSTTSSPIDAELKTFIAPEAEKTRRARRAELQMHPPRIDPPFNQQQR